MIDPLDNVTRPLPVTTASPIRLRFASADRHYTVVLTQDLFSSWIVIQSWGGRFSNRGGGQVKPVASFEEGEKLLRAVEKRRLQRGYCAIE